MSKHINFYSSDAKDSSIIAYGDINLQKKKFKITYRHSEYLCYGKFGGKFIQFKIEDSLDAAKQACFDYLVNLQK